MNLQVRKALESDKQAISDEVIAAFGDEQGQVIVDLITDLLADPSAQPLLALVATTNDNVVGQILFLHPCRYTQNTKTRVSEVDLSKKA